MKYRNNLLIVFAFYVLAACGQTSEANSAVEEKVDALYKAMVEKDEATLKGVTAENLSYGHSSGNLEDKTQFIEAVMNGPFDYLSITPEDGFVYVMTEYSPSKSQQARLLGWSSEAYPVGTGHSRH